MTIKLYSYKDEFLFEHTEPGNTEKRTLEYAKEQGVSLKEVYVFNQDLSGIDLSGMNLNRTGFLWCNLTGANLSDCRFECSVFNLANMEGVNLSRSHLYGTKLSTCNLKNANLHGANLFEAVLCHANLTGANLYGAYIAKTNLTEAILEGVTWGANCLPDDKEDSNYIVYPSLGFEGRTLQYNIKDNLITSGCFRGTKEQYIRYYRNRYINQPIYYKQYEQVFESIDKYTQVGLL